MGATTVNDVELLSVTKVARELGIGEAQVRRLDREKKIPSPQRVAGNRIFLSNQLPAIREAAREAGFLDD